MEQIDGFNAQARSQLPADLLQDLTRHIAQLIQFIQSGAAKQVLTEGAPAPEFTLPDAFGNPVTLLHLLQCAEAALRELAVRRQTEAALRESEARLQRANVELERANRLKSTFLANMSHEIRTLLNGVLGLAQLLWDTPLDARQQEYAAGIQSSGTALLALVSEILDLSKIEAGEMALERAPVDLRALVADVVEVVAVQVRAKELELVSFVDPAIPPVLMGDPTRLRQVLLNLVGNAVKFTERGGVAVRVGPAAPEAGRSAKEEGGMLIRGAVEDTGIGIAAEVHGRLFDAFAQADETMTRRHGGTGLGLAICKQLVELMGGEIGVESVLETGSTFWFTARLGDAEAGGTYAPILPRDGPALDGTALMVGGPAPVRAALRDQLTAWGMRVEEAADAAGALHALREGAARGGGYDVALVDEHLPDMTAVELARQLRGAPAMPPLLLLTARDRIAGDSLPAGIAAWLANPVRPAQLYGAVAQLVGRTTPDRGVGTQERLSTVVPAQAGARSGRILVAEDNLVNQLVTVHLVEALGYQVETVEDGRKAVRAVERGAYDLVLMDCHMPQMDGFTATAEIRRREERSGRHTPIIALTADALSGDAEKCLAAGMDDYLAKPVTPERLREVVARWAS